MKKILIPFALMCAALLICAIMLPSACCRNEQETSFAEDSTVEFTPRMMIVHRVFVFPNTYGRSGSACFRDRTGEEIIVRGSLTDFDDLKYVQPGDTLFFKTTKLAPEVLRIGFKD